MMYICTQKHCLTWWHNQIFVSSHLFLCITISEEFSCFGRNFWFSGVRKYPKFKMSEKRPIILHNFLHANSPWKDANCSCLRNRNHHLEYSTENSLNKKIIFFHTYGFLLYSQTKNINILPSYNQKWFVYGAVQPHTDWNVRCKDSRICGRIILLLSNKE